MHNNISVMLLLKRPEIQSKQIIVNCVILQLSALFTLTDRNLNGCHYLAYYWLCLYDFGFSEFMNTDMSESGRGVTLLHEVASSLC